MAANIVAKDWSVGEELDGLTQTADVDSGIGFVGAVNYTQDLGCRVPDCQNSSHRFFGHHVACRRIVSFTLAISGTTFRGVS
nr:hypothetical protein [Mesorhizobium sp. M4A.F.Ca.ET.050.02.1.1]